jgi:hypothetical protein
VQCIQVRLHQPGTGLPAASKSDRRSFALRVTKYVSEIPPREHRRCSRRQRVVAHRIERWRRVDQDWPRVPMSWIPLENRAGMLTLLRFFASELVW